MTHPIFFDPSGRRARRTSGVVLVLVAALLAAIVACCLALTSARGRAPIRFAEDAARPVAIAATARAAGGGAWLPAATAQPARGTREVFAFYMPWDEASRRALRDHAGEIDWVVPGLATVGVRAVMRMARNDAVRQPSC